MKAIVVLVIILLALVTFFNTVERSIAKAPVKALSMEQITPFVRSPR